MIMIIDKIMSIPDSVGIILCLLVLGASIYLGVSEWRKLNREICALENKIQEYRKAEKALNPAYNALLKRYSALEKSRKAIAYFENGPEEASDEVKQAILKIWQNNL